MADLGYTSKLKIVIVPSGQSYNSPTEAEMTGQLIFREADNIIEVNGHSYKSPSDNFFTAITNALKNTGYLTESNDGVLTAQNTGKVEALLGTKIATASGDGVNTVSGWITSLQSDIADINTSIGTDGSGNFVVRNKTSQDTDFANTTAIHTAINSAKTGAEQTAAADATSKVSTAKSELIGNGTDSTNSESTALNPGEGKTWAVGEANTKTLSHLKDLILNLQGQLNTLSGNNLEQIQNAIDDIKKELIDPAAANQTTTLNTILDHLKTLYGGTTQQSFSVNGETQTTLTGIISALENEISNVASTAAAAHSTVGGATGSYITVTSATGATGTSSGHHYIVSTNANLDTAIANARSNAEATAKGYADNVISWTVIGATGVGQ